MVRALRRVSDVAGLGLSGLDVSAVPHRRAVALVLYGMAAKATALRRHPDPRRLATLVATVRSLEAKAADDEPYHREIKAMRSLQEAATTSSARCSMAARASCATATATGWRTSLGALGMILNTITLWNTVYLDHALEQLRASAGTRCSMPTSRACRRTCDGTSTSTGTTPSRRPTSAALGGRCATPRTRGRLTRSRSSRDPQGPVIVRTAAD